MTLMFITEVVCPICGYRNRGVLSTTGQPTMRGFHAIRTFGLVCPYHCRECIHPMNTDRADAMRLEAESATKLEAWRERQRAKRKRRAA